MLLSVTQFAQKHGKDAGRIRRLILDGRLPAQKLGNQWVIDENTPMPQDMRVKSGKYIGDHAKRTKKEVE